MSKESFAAMTARLSAKVYHDADVFAEAMAEELPPESEISAIAKARNLIEKYDPVPSPTASALTEEKRESAGRAPFSAIKEVPR